MNVMNEETYLTERVEDQIKWYSTKSRWNQKMHKRLRIAEILFAALIPFIVTFVNQQQPFYKVLVGILGIAVTIISGCLGIFKFQENWIEYRTTSESLKHEKFLFLTRSEPYNTENAYYLFVQRVEGLISKENSGWSYLMAANVKEDGKS